GARNTGIRNSSGRYLSFLDSDDLWLPDKIRCQVEFMKERECSFSFTSYDFGDEQGHSTGRTVRAPEKLDYRHALTRTVIFTSTVMFDREKIPKDILVMPDVPSEDTALWWKVMRNGYTACGIDRIFTIYRRSGNTLSSDKVEACRRIWNLYRSVEGLSLARSAACFVMWAARATLRRI
nr:glycosyltransferase family 2 protein [Lachnospiraceae bacterium]